MLLQQAFAGTVSGSSSLPGVDDSVGKLGFDGVEPAGGAGKKFPLGFAGLPEAEGHGLLQFVVRGDKELHAVDILHAGEVKGAAFFSDHDLFAELLHTD